MSSTFRARLGYNWMLVVALLIVAAWALRLILVGPGIGMSLWMTSAGLVLVGVLLVTWYTGRRRRRVP
jgi:hypothetical protein